MKIALDILSDNLFKEVRTKRNMAYAVQSGMRSSRVNSGIIYISTTVPNEAMEVIFNEIEKMKTEYISEERIEEAVNGFITSYYLSNEGLLDQAIDLGSWEVRGYGWEESFAFVENLRKVSPEDIREVANKYIKNINFATLGPQDQEIDETFFVSTL